MECYIKFMENYTDIFSFWKSLTLSQVEFLEQNIRTIVFNKGKLVHRSDGGCQGIMAVRSGSLRVYCISEEGREVTLYRVGAGEICVLSASCLMDSIVFDVLIEAVEKTTVSLVPSSILHKVEEENPLVSLYIYKNATEKFSEVLWTLQQVLFLKIDQRIENFLRDESLRQKSKILSVTHDEIAREIGSVREVVTKTLKYMEENGLVSLGRGKIEILA